MEFDGFDLEQMIRQRRIKTIGELPVADLWTHALALALGVLLVLAMLWEVFEVIVLPRRIIRRVRLVAFFYRSTWRLWEQAARRIRSPRTREWFLGVYGPLSLPVLLLVWASGCIVGFALILWGTRVPLTGLGGVPASLGPYLYLSGVTFFTLGYGDVAPSDATGRVVAVLEAGTGFGLLAIVIGYLPVIYQAFSRREVLISLLDARAGSPPSAERLLITYAGQDVALEQLLRDWEQWSADLLENTMSYPVLGYFRSQHSNESWLSALTTILDTCVMSMALVEDSPAWQARMTFAMGRHALVDLAQVYDAAPTSGDTDRLPPEALAAVELHLRQAGLGIRKLHAAERMAGLRQMYEPYVIALATKMFLATPEWTAPQSGGGNWQKSAWEGITPEAVRSLLGDHMHDEHDE